MGFIFYYGKPFLTCDSETVRVIAPFIPLASHCHSRYRLLQTDDKLSSRDTLLELVKAALQTFQALANNSRLGHGPEATVLERFWEVFSIYSFADFGVLYRKGQDCI
jgi:hypothetical protein